MAKGACPKFALCLLAIALLTVPRLAFAEEAHAKSDHQAAPEGKGEAAKEDHGSKSDHGKGEGSTGRDAKSPQPKAAESDRIDTHIDAHTDSDAPRLPLHRDDDRGQRAKPKSFPDGNARLHLLPAAPVSGPVVRNSIGVALPPREAIIHFNGPAGAPPPPVMRTPPAALAVAPLTTAKAVEGVLGTNRMTHASATPSITVPTVRSGAISGTGLAHHGTGPSQIGGPAKSVAVINGTAIKAKR
jgi:hypothetical protein